MPHQELKRELFPTAHLTSTTGSITVPAELITPGIAITPYLDLSEGVYQLGGGFTLTHTTSGRMFIAGQACIECARATAQRLAALDIAWTSVDPSSKDTIKASLGDRYADAIKAMRVFGNCVQQVCAVGDDGKLETCDACGFVGSHAPYCASVVLPMVAAHNKAVGR